MTHRCRRCAASDQEALIEHVASEMWLSRRVDASDSPWAEVGDFWQQRFRELAAVAVQAMRGRD